MKGFSSNIDCSDLVSSTTSHLVRGMRFDNQAPVPVDSIFSWGCDPEDILANKYGICDIVVDSTTNGDSKRSIRMEGIEGLLLTVAPSLVQPNNTGSSTGGSSSSFAELKPLPFDYRIENSDLLTETNNNSILVNNNNKTVIDVSLNLFKSEDDNNNNELYFGDSVTTTVMEGLGSVVQELAQKEEAMGYLTPEIDDIAALIGTAIADSTAQQQQRQRNETSQQLPQVPEGAQIERDPWADIDNWIENAFSKNEHSDSDSSEFLSPTPTLSSCSINPVTSTLHSLLTKGRSNTQVSSIKIEPAIDMPLLHGRLIAGRPETLKPSISYEYPSCSLARKDTLPHTTFGNHVSTTLPHIDSFSRRQIPKIKDVNIDDFTGEKISKKNRLKSKMVTSSSPTQSYLESGKEKPLHRCTICSRGFLNKSNIKVHLRTHTGEKPFKCEHCAKAFRQKAHLLKHMQIHKRISRD